MSDGLENKFQFFRQMTQQLDDQEIQRLHYYRIKKRTITNSDARK